MKGFWLNLFCVFMGSCLFLACAESISAIAEEVPAPTAPLCGNAELCDEGCKKGATVPAGANGTACTVPGNASPCKQSSTDCKLGCGCVKIGSTNCACEN